MAYRSFVVVLLSLAGTLAAAPALAADPVPGAHYAGQTSQQKLRFEFRAVAAGGAIEQLLVQFRAPHCESASSQAQGTLRPPRLAVREGGFAHTGREVEKLRARGDFGGGRQIERYTLTGSFPTADLATGTLAVTVTVRDKRGAIISTCMHRKPITFAADRLGLGEETEE